MKKTRLTAYLLSGCLMAASLAVTNVSCAWAATDGLPEARTESEIREFFESNPFTISGGDTYDVEPDINAEVAGKLSDESVQNALNALNFVRFVAGLPSDVTNSDEYERMAQAGTTLLMKIGSLNHTPSQPAGVSKEFYDLAYSGTSASNLGMGYGNLGRAVIEGWMEDGDAGNIDRVGHRRWCLSPKMGQTGFGHSGSFTAMYSFDKSDNASVEYIAWPAQVMPVEYFYGPWSLMFDSDITAKPSSVKVTMVNTTNGEEYVLTNSDKSVKGKYLNVNMPEGNMLGYGYMSALIFQPGVTFKAGDVVNVTITGLSSGTVEYTVHFFSMKEETPNIPLTGLVGNETEKMMKVGDTWQFKVTPSPAGANDTDMSRLQWTSSNDAVASVSGNGLVTAKGAGTATITATVKGISASCKITVTDPNASGDGENKPSDGNTGNQGGNSSDNNQGGGSSDDSGSGWSAGSSKPKGSKNGSGSSQTNSNHNNSQNNSGTKPNLPSYVTYGSWTEQNGSWTFEDTQGVKYRSCWAAVYNPYANVSAGQQEYDWFFFDEAGNMKTGWMLDGDGNYYYLNNGSNGTRGSMMTGWCWIPDANGVRKCYYLNPNSDGTRGKLLTNASIGGFTVNANGEWVVDGVVQTR
ncbi:MAG: hypothetical protein HFG14_12065 [Lachnospiraceae bacterium]|nr:hypothetical protein [Lachnospiraceae bacterium]